MIKPTQLLKNFGMLRITFEDAHICCFGRFVLQDGQRSPSGPETATYVFLLLVDVPNLKPDVGLIQWMGWTIDNVLKALLGSAMFTERIDGSITHLETLLIFALLFIYYA